MTYNIACIGEPLAEISRGAADLAVAFGGDTLNTAIYCARSVQDSRYRRPLRHGDRGRYSV